MGYTHYWYLDRNFTDDEWDALVHGAEWLVKEIGSILTGWNGDTDTDIKIDSKRISFNGIESGAHETLYLQKMRTENEYKSNDGRAFYCCKTARKPYDIAVVFMLTHMKVATGIQWTSDGSELDWKYGMDLYRNYMNAHGDFQEPKLSNIYGD